MHDLKDYIVFIGRFQPFHKGHYQAVKHALNFAKEVIIVIGSHDEPRSSRNPFTTEERISIIKSAFDGNGDMNRIHFVRQPDHTYNMDKWVASIQGAVFNIIHKAWRSTPVKIGLIGYEKDHSSYYLKMFPTWETIKYKPSTIVNSTEIRQQFFNEWDISTLGFAGWTVSNFHFDTVKALFNTKDLEAVKKEYKFVEKYKKQWSTTPYPVTFNTVDALVVQSGHILVVERGAEPGLGQLALPGGFVNQWETLEDAVIRELYEETRIDVPKPVIKGSIINEKTFDDPWRSDRGRTITTCYHIRLRDDPKLPKIKGGDDAAKAYWIPLEQFIKSRNLFFEDHYSIVESMLGL